MKIVLLSDTHNRHAFFEVPAGDLLLHAGDFSGKGRLDEVQAFLNWFAAQPHPHKVLIAGNHDFLAERDPAAFQALIPPGVTYLNDSGAEIGGIPIWGSPVQPVFFDWAFNRRRGAEIRQHWALIPPETQILITHGPPMGILDRTEQGQSVGCEELAFFVEKIKPRLHVFGHIHEGYGMMEKDGTTFVNASNVNLRYEPVNAPVVIEW